MTIYDIMNGEIEVSRKELKQEMEQQLEKRGELNAITLTLVNKILELHDTAIRARECIIEYGVLMDQPTANGQVKQVSNPAVNQQTASIAGMSRLIAQLKLDQDLEEYPVDEDEF